VLSILFALLRENEPAVMKLDMQMELKPRMRAAIRQKMGKKTQQIRNSEIT
jgi:hypothetical protein